MDMNIDKYVDERLLDESEREGPLKRSAGKANQRYLKFSCFNAGIESTSAFKQTGGNDHERMLSGGRLE